MRPIDADALVERLERMSNNYTEIYERLEAGDQSKAVIYGKFTAIVETMIDVKRMPTLDHAPKWISVKDDLPALVCMPCLIYADGCTNVADWSHDKYSDDWWFYVDGEYDPEVTHWMPLPEPPKEE